MRPVWLAIASIIALSGCSQQQSSHNPLGEAAQLSSTTGGVLSSLRPHADPALVEKIKEDEARQAQAAMQADATAGGAQTGPQAPVNLQPASLAPHVSQHSAGGPIVTPAQQAPAGNNPFPWWPFGTQQQNQAPAPAQPQVATYGGYGGGAVPPPPPGATGALVPPPPAVSYQAQGQLIPPFGAVPPPADPYSNQGATIAAQSPGAHAAGSFFGSGGRVSGDSAPDDSRAARKAAGFVPITPTGMEARSPYKQRDDLKVLWKGALASSPLQQLINKDDKLGQEISRIDVGLPGEATKGSLSASQRQIDTIFKPAPLDKKIATATRQLEADVVQAYYRYLYSYNKFALLQQTVAARKQEVDVAGSASEQQRAAADLAQAQSDADAAKDDMRAAQLDLAARSGAQAARVIIGRVSGVAPSAESLAAAEPATAAPARQPAGGGVGRHIFGAVESMFGFGHDRKEDKKTVADNGKAARPPARRARRRPPRRPRRRPPRWPRLRRAPALPPPPRQPSLPQPRRLPPARPASRSPLSSETSTSPRANRY